ncbi:MAG: hypothetical protein M1818_003562 [Claussenomyces sp. TS43310]|nr:MAG: hypothetical protein M1818_003562 [Claussenomyces sp. TS43310]
MGRSASAPKRPPGTAANQHNSRHENGLVEPRKNPRKQKSNGHLNGHARSAEKLPSTPSLPPTPPRHNGHARQHDEMASEGRMVADALTQGAMDAYAESSSSESYHVPAPTISISGEENHRRIDVNAAKNPAVHRDAGPLSLLVTVLRSCPLYDTIAILIVLLQIPPTFLTIVHFLFATLTFVPPSTSSHSTLTLTDIFEGTLGTPSIATIIAVDALVLLVWLFLWGPLQETTLDLSQTVIALTLGGGTSGRDAGFNNVLVCLGIIGVSYLARIGGIKKSRLRMLFPAASSSILGPESDYSLEPPTVRHTKGSHAWIRTILAIHILTQGVVRYIRDWYVRRERRDSLLNGLGDPEAAKGSIPHGENATESSSSTPNTLPADLDSHSVLPIGNGQDKTPNPKKKKRVSAQVRIRQPLWAALASTKIVMAKEYETSRSAAESAGTNATDVNNLGNAPFNTEADRIWITYVGFDEVCFNTSYFPSYAYSNSSEAKDRMAHTPGVDMSKPFYVRVNKSIWQPTRINPLSDTPDQTDSDLHWGGEIFGLAPMSNYDCEFFSTVDGSLIFSTSVRTMQAPTSDTASAPMLSPSVQQSPTTTLRTSIATAELKLQEERNRQKRERKDQKNKLNAARKELDKLSSNIASAGGSDDRLRQKVQQSNLHAKQADDATILLTEQLESLDNLPGDESREHRSQKSAWQSQKEVNRASRNEFQTAKQAAEREVQALTAEVTTFQQKKERMQGRIAKLNGEYERITDANARGLDEAQRRASERDARELDRTRIETYYTDRMDLLEPQIQNMQLALSEIWSSTAALQHADYLATQAQIQQSPSATVAGVNPYDIPEGTVHHSAQAWAPSRFVPSHGHFGMAFHHQHSHHGHRARGRSSSMLSNVSGFTQSSGDEPPLPTDFQDVMERERQSGSSSASASASVSASGTSGSIGDPKSPVQGHSSGAMVGGARSVNPCSDE